MAVVVGGRRAENRSDAPEAGPAAAAAEPGAWAAAPTTFKRETGDLRARGAPLPARPPSYIRETCPGRRLPCACAADSGRDQRRGRRRGGEGWGATVTSATALGTAGLVGCGGGPGRAGGGGGCWAVPSRWGGGRSPSTAWIRPGTPTPLPRLGRPIAHRPGETPAVPATCCRPLNLLPLNPARPRGVSQPVHLSQAPGERDSAPATPPPTPPGGDPRPTSPLTPPFSLLSLSRPPPPPSSQAPTARTWCDRIASLTRTSLSKVAKFGDPFHVPSVPGSRAAVPLTPPRPNFGGPKPPPTCPAPLCSPGTADPC
ncbi:uncharacterized protein ACIBXB_015862 isoform 1-T2 [Morphnus guianensis]